MSDANGNIEDIKTGQPNKLLVLAVLGGVILIAHLPIVVIYAFYIENYCSTNDWMVFLVLPVFHLILLTLLPVLFSRRMPSVVTLDCIWTHWTRSEFIKFLLLPIGILITLVIKGILMYWFELPTIRIFGFAAGYDAYRNTSFLISLTICSVLLFPIVEEVFWRGYMQSTLLRICHPALAILCQAVLFGLVHFRPVLGFLNVFMYGLIFGIWSYRRKTLVPIIIMHIVINSFVCILRWTSWLELRQIRITHDYVAEFIELSKPSPYDPNNDARGEYAEASQLVVEFPSELKEVRQRYPTQWSQEERAQVETWVASNAVALDLVERGTQKAYYWVEYEHKNKQMLTVFPRYADRMKHLTFSFCMRAIIRADQGQYEQSFMDVETCYKLGRHLLENKDLLSQLIGMAVRGHALETARIILANEDINSMLMTRFQRLFEKTADYNDVRFDFIGEKLMVLDVIQQIFTDDGHGGGHIPRCFFRKLFFPDGQLEYVLSIISIEEEPDTTAWRRLERRNTTTQIEQYYNLLGRACSLSSLQYERDIEGIKTSIEQIKKTNPLIRIFSPAIDRLVHIAARACVDLDASIAILGILRYKDDTQKYPDGLSQLVAAGYIKNVPVDPFSDKPIVYMRTGDGFMLYSFGSDFDDDGGTPSKWGEGEKGGDQVFWPVKESIRVLESATKSQLK